MAIVVYVLQKISSKERLRKKDNGRLHPFLTHKVTSDLDQRILLIASKHSGSDDRYFAHKI